MQSWIQDKPTDIYHHTTYIFDLAISEFILAGRIV